MIKIDFIECIFLQLMEGEKANQSLRGELRDQEELVHRLMSLETENTALSAELSQVQINRHEVGQPFSFYCMG